MPRASRTSASIPVDSGRNVALPVSNLIAVVETNLAVKNKVRQYYRSEEQRVLDESNRILELENEVG